MSQSLGLTVFDHLYAEDEPWLFEVFEPPSEFELISGSRSVVVYGETGAGKSALYAALIQSSLDTQGKPTRLLVEWNLKPPGHGVEPDSNLVHKQIIQILDACAFSVLRHIGHYPADFAVASDWTKNVIRWFALSYLHGEFVTRTGALARTLSAEGKALLTCFHTEPVPPFLPPDSPPQEVMAELVKAVEELGLNGIWVLVDRLDDWDAYNTERLAAALTAFLSTLGLFERSGLAYKLILPMAFRSHLAYVSGMTRRRLDTHYLLWTTEKLTSVLLKRLSVALGRPVESLTEVCTDTTLLQWVERCGGHSPRGWLEAIRPLVAAYLQRLQQGNPAPVERAEWLAIRRRHPPQLALDQQRQEVIVGERVIDNLSDGQYALIEYLYQRAGRICTREELHYRATLKLDYEPRSTSDSAWEPPKAYSSKLDTAIWRLRDLVEPDPEDEPLFIKTFKGKGYRLDNSTGNVPKTLS